MSTSGGVGGRRGQPRLLPDSPRSQALGLDVDYDFSPTALKKVVYAGTQATSFPQGSRDLKELAELDVSPERVRRATERIGQERVAERDAQAVSYEALPIPARRTVSPDQSTPAVACVQMDGGRLQFLDRAELQRNEDDTFWREMKVGCLGNMTSNVSTEDPCPRLPASFVDPERMQRMVREIKRFSGPDGSVDDTAEEERIDERPGRPRPLNYPKYRKQGLPMTSTYVESTVKQINRRMKGTEKFRSHGVESMLTLVADHLSDTPTLTRFWRDRPHRLTGCRGDQSHAV